MGALVLHYDFAFCNDKISKSILNWEITQNDIYQNCVSINENDTDLIEDLDYISSIIKEHVLMLIKENPYLNSQFNWNNVSFCINDINYDWITIH